MKTVRDICRFVLERGCAAAVGLTLMAGSNAFGGDVQFDVLRTRTGTFTNVTVHAISKTDIFIRHKRGIGNVKLKDLDQETLDQLVSVSSTNKSLGSSKKPAPATGEGTPSSFDAANVGKDTPASGGESGPKLSPNLAMVSAMSPVRLSPAVLLAVMALLLSIYLFFCYCLKSICKKTGNEPGLMVWFPILQIFPMLRAAGMSAVWFLAFLIPVLNVVAQIVWCFKIVQARGKSVWVAIGLLLPFVSLVAFLYLAFSGAGNSDEEETVRIVTPPVLTEA